MISNIYGEALWKGHGCGFDLLFTLRENHEEDKFFDLGNDLLAFLSID
jgi:hypothetical protein